MTGTKCGDNAVSTMCMLSGVTGANATSDHYHNHICSAFLICSFSLCLFLGADLFWWWVSQRILPANGWVQCQVSWPWGRCSLWWCYCCSANSLTHVGGLASQSNFLSSHHPVSSQLVLESCNIFHAIHEKRKRSPSGMVTTCWVLL